MANTSHAASYYDSGASSGRNLEDSALIDVNNRSWSYEEMKKRRNRRRTSFFYAGFGFSISGAAFSLSNSNMVLSNGFMAKNPLLGDLIHLGYEYSGSIGYFATEIYGSFLFSIGSEGLVGSSAIGDSISLTSFGRGLISAGVNVKPGLSFNNSKGAVYLIVGAGYQWIEGKYTNSSGTTFDFNMSGFALNYGIGMKYTLHGFVMLFLDFVAVAPIAGHGALGLDRTAYEVNTRTPLTGITGFEYYSVNLGLDFRV